MNNNPLAPFLLVQNSRRYAARFFTLAIGLCIWCTPGAQAQGGATSESTGDKAILMGAVKSESGANWQQVGPNHLRLDSGSMLLHPSMQLKVTTPHGNIFIHKNCAVLINVNQKISRFLVLYDTWSGGVTVTTDKHSRKLTSGYEMAVAEATNANEAMQELVQDGLRRRHVKFTEDLNKCYVATDQFSIPDAILKKSMLSALARSSDRADRSMYDHMIKVAAAIAMTGAPEPYTVHE